MNDARKIIRRIADGVEDAIEDIVGGGEEEHGHHRLHPEQTSAGHAGVGLPGPETVNVYVDCCDCRPRRTPLPPLPGTRPPHVTGTSAGAIPGGAVNPGGIVDTLSRPPNVWPGQRDKLYLPFLFMRANAGDLGARPVVGPFWESPDILIEPGVDPANAPAIPTSLGAIAKAGVDNTLYAHVWNLGMASCSETLVEFYWFNPALGFDAAHANLVGATWTDLRGRGDVNSHRLVRCPVSWRAQFLNGGHECLMVRVSQAVLDPLSAPGWDASRNRHIGQRNIHVMSAAEAAAKPTLPIAVGPLFGGVATVTVQRAGAHTMPWLHLATMDRNRLPGTGVPTGDLGITPPTPEGVPLPNLGGIGDPRGAGLMQNSHGVTADGQQVGFHTTDADPGPGNAHVYRVTGNQNGSVFGGYTVVILGGH